jgi:hypothetical protein
MSTARILDFGPGMDERASVSFVRRVYDVSSGRATLYDSRHLWAYRLQVGALKTLLLVSQVQLGRSAPVFVLVTAIVEFVLFAS